MAQRPPWDPEKALRIIAQNSQIEGPLMPVLRALLDEFGHIPLASEGLIAKELNLSRAEVHGVVSFYHDFRRARPARNELKLCRAEACQAMGAERIADLVQQALGIGFGETASDESVSLEPVFCLGLCATAPSAMLNGRPYGRLRDETIAALLERLEG